MSIRPVSSVHCESLDSVIMRNHLQQSLVRINVPNHILRYYYAKWLKSIRFDVSVVAYYTGSILPELGQLTFLIELYLSFNKLNGKERNAENASLLPKTLARTSYLNHTEGLIWPFIFKKCLLMQVTFIEIVKRSLYILIEYIIC